MKTVIELIAQAWDEVTPETLRKSWRKILPVPREDGPGDDTVHDEKLAADELVALLTGNSFNLDMLDIQEIHEILTDEEICEKVEATVNPADDSEAEPDSEEETDLPCPVSHSRAMDMFDECLTWLQQQPEASYLLHHSCFEGFARIGWLQGKDSTRTSRLKLIRILIAASEYRDFSWWYNKCTGFCARKLIRFA